MAHALWTILLTLVEVDEEESSFSISEFSLEEQLTVRYSAMLIGLIEVKSFRKASSLGVDLLSIKMVND